MPSLKVSKRMRKDILFLITRKGANFFLGGGLGNFLRREMVDLIGERLFFFNFVKFVS